MIINNRNELKEYLDNNVSHSNGENFSLDFYIVKYFDAGKEINRVVYFDKLNTSGHYLETVPELYWTEYNGDDDLREYINTVYDDDVDKDEAFKFLKKMIRDDKLFDIIPFRTEQFLPEKFEILKKIDSVECLDFLLNNKEAWNDYK